MDYTTPVGFRDILPEEAARREEVSQRVMALFADAGYAPVETPTLERMDALDAASRTTGATFRLFDTQGDLLALRPDVTMQVARIAATRLRGMEGPVRLRYQQRVFRDVDVQAEAREMTQIGIECIGPAGAEADAEVVGLFAQALQQAGLGAFSIVLGAVGPLRALLEACEAPDAWKRSVLAAYHRSDFVELDELCASPDSPEGFAGAIASLPRMRGGREAIDAARALVAPLGCADGLDGFAATYDTLAASGLEGVVLVDFSIMSSFDYYTGIVFEAYAPGMGRILGSGGRYDTMLEALGASPRPAAGFSFSLEQVMEACGFAVLTNGGEALLTWEEPAGLGTSASETISGTSETLADSSTTCASAVRPLRIAVPKGSLNVGAIAALAAAGLDVTGLDDPGRQMVVSNPGVDFIIVRPSDAPAFVASGAADCGICGNDSLVETGADVVELADLAFGSCTFVVAQPAGTTEAVMERYRNLGSIRVATKYPNIARRYFARVGMQVETVPLHGNIELAPMVGMAERIVDITASGTTLRENNLEVVDEVMECTARFFANPASFRLDRRVMELAERLRENL